MTPLHAFLLAQCAHDAGLPPGVFNLITGAGGVAGEALVRHPGVDVVSLTGSTTSGQRVGALAAEGVKRVVLELGGKSASLVLDDADLETAVRTSVDQAFVHGGQVCFAWTRLVVPRDRHDEAAEIAAAAIAGKRVGDPTDEAVDIGPVVSDAQRSSVRGYIDRGIAEGARLVCGGSEAPEGLEQRGYYVRPTVFADVDNAMTIAQEEIFGPVLTIIAHDGDDDAVRIANDSPYGLHGAVFAEDEDRAVAVARQIRTGLVDINGGPLNHFAPFGGVKHSGVGRDHGRYGLAEYQEVKSIQFPVGA
jgi:acyl-CoA reductase-like NAD-dependent aldehyde dehydrogenase